MGSKSHEYAGDISAWDLLVPAREITELIDFLIERLEAGEDPLAALKALRALMLDRS